jgi:hypothetical protein
VLLNSQLVAAAVERPTNRWAPPGIGRLACLTGEAVPQAPGSSVRPAESYVVSQYDCATPVKPQKKQIAIDRPSSGRCSTMPDHRRCLVWSDSVVQFGIECPIATNQCCPMAGHWRSCSYRKMGHPSLLQTSCRQRRYTANGCLRFFLVTLRGAKTTGRPYIATKQT